MIDVQTAERPRRKRKKRRAPSHLWDRHVKRRLPTLRFSPYAWAKLLFLRDCGDCEVGGFGITGEDDLLLIEDVCLVRQYSTPVSVRFDDAAVADFFDEQVDRGRRPEQFARVWLHTHPGNSAQPSGIDEETFERCFGGTDWSVMFVLARGGRTYARLQFNVGPGGSMELPVEVDFRQPFGAADQVAWKREYADAVQADINWLADVWGEDLPLLGAEGSSMTNSEAVPADRCELVTEEAPSCSGGEGR